jgi:hypothetical protein
LAQQVVQEVLDDGALLSAQVRGGIVDPGLGGIPEVIGQLQDEQPTKKLEFFRNLHSDLPSSVRRSYAPAIGSYPAA